MTLTFDLITLTLLQVLMAVSKLEEEDRQGARKCAKEALQDAVNWDLIKAQKITK